MLASIRSVKLAVLTRNPRNAFTLIELLVVIAIIALLAAILFPVFGRARENARRSACASNMKQVSLGVMQYVQDFDEKYPISGTSPLYTMLGVPTIQATSPWIVEDFANPTGSQWRYNWIHSLQPYTKSWQVFRCASAKRPTGTDAQVKVSDSPVIYVGNIAPTANSNASFAASSVFVGRPLSSASVQSPASIIFIQEGEFYYGAAMCFPFSYDATYSHTITPNGVGHHFFWLGNKNCGTKPECGTSFNHFSGGNHLYADGHVKWRRQSDLMPHDYGFQDTVGCGTRGKELTEFGNGTGATSCVVDKTLISFPN